MPDYTEMLHMHIS